MNKIKSFLFVSLLFLVCSYANASQLTYSYSTPYSGSSKITIINTTDQPITITKLIFTNNADIAGTPWGILWGWQSTIANQKNADGITVEHTISENPVITIGAKQSVDLNYNIDTNHLGGSLSPYNLAMDPVSVSVVYQGGSYPTPIDITGKCEGQACIDPGKGKRITGYFADWAYWRDPKFIASQIPYNKINTIPYAFSIFDKDGNVSLYDQDSDAVNVPIISQARKQRPYLNASLSFGGWSWFSTPPGWQCQTGDSPAGPAACFKQLAADKNAVQRFSTAAVLAMKEVQFNGIDIDWEYPAVEDAANYIALLQSLRKALDAQGALDQTHYYLTIAVGAGIDKINNLTKEQWLSVADAVDYMGVMTYDFHGAWDQYSDFMSAMQLDPNNDPTINDQALKRYNLTDAMQAYLDMGIPSSKLIVGIPMYGRMMKIAKAGTTQGLYQPVTGVPQGEWDNSQSGYTGMLNYNCIVDPSTCGNHFNLPRLTLVDPSQSKLGQYALTPWGYADNLFVTYDDAKSAAYKVQWIKKNQFGGAMLWDLTSDFPGDDNRSIVNAVYQEFNR